MNLPRITGPDGIPLALSKPANLHLSLADWLEINGHPLNTRCGKRGLCQGCRVETESGEEIAACQNTLSTLEGRTLHIPPGSLRDATLTGVTEFELDPNIPGSFSLPDGPGIALDIGTTTLAGALWAGDPPQSRAVATRPNPQIRFGDNVVSRIQHCLDTPSGLDDLHRVLVEEGIQPLLSDLCIEAGYRPQDISRMTVSGNPVMLHTLARASLSGFASYPFQPEFLTEMTLSGSQSPVNCPVTLLPSAGPFLGSDVLGGAVANGFFKGEGARLLIDFGTNGELLLRDATGNTWATATAAGPAFEGGRLRCGGTAGPGVIGRLGVAIDGSWILPDSDVPRRAMAGAAYVDFMAIGLKQGWLSPMGRFLPDGPGRASLTASVSVSENDIAELLQAKAAIQAGWTTLLECAGLEVDELCEIVVAGGFGYHLTPAHAVTIGLLPPVNLERIHLVGNASLAGASVALLDSGQAKRWQTHIQHMKVIELNQQESFEDHYIDAMMLSSED